MTIFNRIKQFLIRNLSSLIGAIKAAIDIRDIVVFGGLGMLGYGLYLFIPWLAFVICGGLLMLIGLFFGRPKK